MESADGRNVHPDQTTGKDLLCENNPGSLSRLGLGLLTQRQVTHCHLLFPVRHHQMKRKKGAGLVFYSFTFGGTEITKNTV